MAKHASTKKSILRDCIQIAAQIEVLRQKILKVNQNIDNDVVVPIIYCRNASTNIAAVKEIIERADI